MTSRGSLSPADQPYNIILAGAYGVGKTGLFKKLSGEVHSDYQYRTVPSARDASRTTGQQFGHWTHTALVDGDTVKVTLWDTGNLERAGIRNVTRSYFRYAVGVALVYDVGNRETLDDLYDWVLRIKDSVSWQWESSLCMALWGNNRDQTSTSVSGGQLDTFLGHFGLTDEHCSEVDAYNGCKVFESYHSLIERIHMQSRPPQQNGAVTLPNASPGPNGDIEQENTCSC